MKVPAPEVQYWLMEPDAHPPTPQEEAAEISQQGLLFGPLVGSEGCMREGGMVCRIGCSTVYRTLIPSLFAKSPPSVGVASQDQGSRFKSCRKLL